MFCFILFCLLPKPAEAVLRHGPLFAPEWKRALALTFILSLPLTYCKTQAGCFPVLGDYPSCTVYGTVVSTTVYEWVQLPWARPLWEVVRALPLLASEESRARKVFLSAFYR